MWGQDGWIFAKFFVCVFMDWDRVEVHKITKKNDANIKPSWLYKFVQLKIYYMEFRKFFSYDIVGSSEQAR